MAWVKLDDSFFRNTKIVQISAESRLIYLAGLCYASASLSDGFIPKNAVRILAAEAGVTAGPKRLKELVNAGLWVQKPDGYAIHDYLEHNTSADDVRAKREQARSRMQRKRSQNVRANKERSSPEVHPTRVRDTDTDTDTEGTDPDGSDARTRAETATDPELELEGNAHAVPDDQDLGQPDAPVPIPKPSKPTAIDRRFEAFWTAYPSKIGKGAARKAWLRIRPNAELTDRMIAVVEAWKASPRWQEEGGRFVPNPATWLNQERWEDGPPPSGPAPVPIRSYGRPPANIQTHGHDDDIDWEGEYALPAER